MFTCIEYVFISFLFIFSCFFSPTYTYFIFTLVAYNFVARRHSLKCQSFQSIFWCFCCRCCCCCIVVLSTSIFCTFYSPFVYIICYYYILFKIFCKCFCCYLHSISFRSANVFIYAVIYPASSSNALVPSFIHFIHFFLLSLSIRSFFL